MPMLSHMLVARKSAASLPLKPSYTPQNTHPLASEHTACTRSSPAAPPAARTSWAERKLGPKESGAEEEEKEQDARSRELARVEVAEEAEEERIVEDAHEGHVEVAEAQDVQIEQESNEGEEAESGPISRNARGESMGGGKPFLAACVHRMEFANVVLAHKAAPERNENVLPVETPIGK